MDNDVKIENTWPEQERDTSTTEAGQEMCIRPLSTRRPHPKYHSDLVHLAVRRSVGPVALVVPLTHRLRPG
jgi:hypothetical protein